MILVNNNNNPISPNHEHYDNQFSLATLLYFNTKSCHSGYPQITLPFGDDDLLLL